VWKAVEEKGGVNRVRTKRPNFGAAPAYVEGRVVRVGTMGILYCYGATDGEKMWETPIPGASAAMEAARDKALAEKKFCGGPAMLSSPIVAGGKFVCPDYSGGVMGVDPASGEILWRTPGVLTKWSSPCIVHDGDRELLAMHDGSALTIVDPATGDVLSTVGGLGSQDFTPVASGTTVLINGNVSTGTGTWAGYRVTAGSAERMWDLTTHTYNLDGDDNAGRKVTIHDGTGYVAINYKGVNDPYGVYAMDVSTGKVIQEIGPDEMDETPSGWFSQPMVIEDRLLVFTDYRHGANSYAQILFSINEDGTLELIEAGQPFVGVATGYQLDMQPAYADGIMYMRREKGTVVAYDLRADPGTTVRGETRTARSPSSFGPSLRIGAVGLETVVRRAGLSGEERYDLTGRAIGRACRSASAVGVR
jgi:outer membrane protein assembly factor BamB